MASLEIIVDPCEGGKVGKPCKARKAVRVRKVNGEIVGEFCKACGNRALIATASLEKKA